MNVKVGTGAGPSYLAAYDYIQTYNTGSALSCAIANSSSISLFNNNSTNPVTGYIDLFFPNNANFWPTVSWVSSQLSATPTIIYGYATYYSAQEAITAIEFVPNGGNLTSGTFALFGSP